MKGDFEIAAFGGGCFWCTEAVFENLRGVISVRPGYAGGHVENPTYEQVSGGKTGHAEAIEVTFDPKAIAYENLLNVFFATHDPTTPGRQGADVGEQYRSLILYYGPAQKKQAEKFVRRLEAEKIFSRPIVTQIAPLGKFYEAEEYHKHYYRNNLEQPYCQVVINPKLVKLKEKFADFLKPL
jgi:peptide-methionine (S)-S-oxide reductase